jgi:ABC-2 type transport system permease protein
MKSKTIVLFGRLMKHILRSPDTIITTAIMPIAMMLMFVYVFGGAVKPSLGGDINYVNYQLPGILLMAVASGIAYTAFRLFEDMQKGLFARFNSMPVKRSSVLWAHVLTSLVSNMLTIAIIFLVALIIGFRSRAGILDWFAIAGILVLFTLALTWVAVIPGLTAKSVEGASAFSYPIIFLPILSSAFVPTETMPKVLRIFAENQPVTSIVNTLRSLLNSESVGGEIWLALAWCAGIAVAAYLLAMRAYKRKM